MLPRISLKLQDGKVPDWDDIEKDIRSLDDENWINVPRIQKLCEEQLNKALEEVHYAEFVILAEHHYFVSRILFRTGLLRHASFWGHQCIENYLKAFYKKHRDTVKLEHRLYVIVDWCREIKREDALVEHEFIDSSLLKTIAHIFDPYYEYCRYPEQTYKLILKERFTRNRDVEYRATYKFIPQYTYLLDYFVHKMDPLVSHDRASIFKNGISELNMLKTPDGDTFEQLNSIFLENNRNFSAQESELS